MHDLNTQLFYYVNSASGRFFWLDQSFVFLTTYLTQIVFVVVGVYMIIWYPFMQTPASFARLRRLMNGLEMGFSLIATLVIVKLLKYIIAHPRPFETLMDSNLLLTISGGDSFPSGHASLTIALASTVYLRHKRLGILLFLFAMLVAFSRMYVGVHYPLDVLTGILIGLVVPYLIHKAFNR